MAMNSERSREGDYSRRAHSDRGLFGENQTKGRRPFFDDFPMTSLSNRDKPKAGYSAQVGISDRLSLERKKACETLQKSQQCHALRRTSHKTYNEKSNGSEVTPICKSNYMDYLPLPGIKSINISELVTDETIDLGSLSPCSSAISKTTQISFEPTEITGRSTLRINDITQPSVTDLMVTSFAPEVRSLGRTLLNKNIDSVNQSTYSINSESSISSLTDYNASHSLPRTADMSKQSIRTSRSDVEASVLPEHTNLDSVEEFSPGDLMHSQLLLDEISWAKQYAAIPTKSLSAEAKAKAGLISNGHGFDASNISSSTNIPDPDFSVGNFFHMRSENIRNIIRARSPIKDHSPIPLVDSTNATMSTTTEKIKVKKKYDLVDRENVNLFMLKRNDIDLNDKNETKSFVKVAIKTFNDDSFTNSDNEVNKDSPDSNDISYLKSVSAIDRALYNLDLHFSPSKDVNANQIISDKTCKIPTWSTEQHSSQSHSSTTSSSSNHKTNSKNSNMFAAIETISSVAEMILENKENLDPQVVNGAIASKSMDNSLSTGLSDTVSFAETLLNLSGGKSQHQRRNGNQSRSSLSPMAVNLSNSKSSKENELEVAKTPELKIARSYSHDNHNIKKIMPTLSEEESQITSMYTEHINNNNISQSNGKMCSTLLDCEKNVESTTCNNQVLLPEVRTSDMLRFDDLSPLTSPTNSCSPSVANISTTNMNPLDVHNRNHQMSIPVPSIKVHASSPAGSEVCRTYYGTSPRSDTSSGCAEICNNGIRSISRCSTSSEYNHHNGKPVPLKVTTTQISWPSSKLRTDSRKSMQIKNISNKRLTLRLEISGPGFQIVTAPQRTNMITLHAQECRSITVNFCPTVNGLALGELSFYISNSATSSFLDIQLIGYGGRANIRIHNILQGPVGLPFLPLGFMTDLVEPIERSFSIINKGSMPGFATIIIDSMGLTLPRLADSFEIYPPKCIIAPGDRVSIRLVFRPKREQIKKIIKKMDNVLTLAHMRIIAGDESVRQRIHRLIYTMKEDQRTKMTSHIMEMLWTPFPNETAIIDLSKLNEDPRIAMDLATTFRVHEIALSINNDTIDESIETSSLFLSEGDETVLFRTICVGDEAMETKTTCSPTTTIKEIPEKTKADRDILNFSSWSVKPKLIELNGKGNREQHASLFISNGLSTRQQFEIYCNKREYLHFTPTAQGSLSPGRQLEIEVTFNDNRYNHVDKEGINDELWIYVSMNNERIAIPVKIY